MSLRGGSVLGGVVLVLLGHLVFLGGLYRLVVTGRKGKRERTGEGEGADPSEKCVFHNS